MKANEFIKDKGIDKAKRHLELYGWRNTPFIIKLKRLVESHELVESYCGLDGSKRFIERDQEAEIDDYVTAKIKKAILDVESCM